jgi:hypothetical protein
MSGNKESSPSK